MPLTLTKPKSTQLGLDIGSRSVKAVVVSSPNSPKPRLDFCGALEVRENDPKASEKIKAFISQNKLSGMDAAVAIDNPSLKIRKIELPKMPEADLREAVRFKMRDIMEGTVEEYVVRSSLLGESGNKNATRFLLVGYAIKKAGVQELIQRVTSYGLKPVFVEPSIVSIAAGIEQVYPSVDAWHAAIDLGIKKSLMTIIGNGKFYFSRPLAGIQYDPENPAGQEEYHQKLAAEIQNTLDTFAVTFQVEQINRILLSGAGAGIPGIAEYLTTNLGLATEVFDPFQGLEIGPKVNPELAAKSYLFSQAVSLARLKTA